MLNVLPKSAQPGAKAALAEIWQAEDREHAERAAAAFAAEYGSKWPKAAAITEDLNVLLTLYDYPAEHWADRGPPEADLPSTGAGGDFVTPPTYSGVGGGRVTAV